MTDKNFLEGLARLAVEYCRGATYTFRSRLEKRLTLQAAPGTIQWADILALETLEV